MPNAPRMRVGRIISSGVAEPTVQLQPEELPSGGVAVEPPLPVVPPDELPPLPDAAPPDPPPVDPGVPP